MKTKFKREDLLSDDVLYEPLSDVIVDHTRWSVVHEIVFEREGKFWKTSYSTGATEIQEERPWEYEEEVECEEVEPREVTIKRWELVD